ncbi:hypothetical protein MMPV_009336 [Pyropia vietnamensis]
MGALPPAVTAALSVAATARGDERAAALATVAATAAAAARGDVGRAVWRRRRAAAAATAATRDTDIPPGDDPLPPSLVSGWGGRGGQGGPADAAAWAAYGLSPLPVGRSPAAAATARAGAAAAVAAAEDGAGPMADSDVLSAWGVAGASEEPVVMVQVGVPLPRATVYYGEKSRRVPLPQLPLPPSAAGRY